MPAANLGATGARLFADRRGGRDRRAAPRRRIVTSLSPERRNLVDRRLGPERRSTLERRGRRVRHAVETPAEHLRNAVQLLTQGDSGAALERVRRALVMLERR